MEGVPAGALGTSEDTRHTLAGAWGGAAAGWGREADYAAVDSPKGWSVLTVVRKRSQAARELWCQWVGKPWLAAPAGVPERLP